MNIYISDLWATQRKLRNPEQIKSLMASIDSGEEVPPVTINEFPDGSLEVQDGHHRLTARLFLGQKYLRYGEYLLLCQDARRKVRYWRFRDAPWL